MKSCQKCGRNLEEDAEFCSKCGTSIPVSEQPSLASEKTSLEEPIPDIDELIGETVFSYKIEEQIGQGGMGVVYRAVHPTIDKAVAIKFLPLAFSKSDKFIARFEREAKAMSQLSHENIVKIENMGEYKGKYFLIMEYIPGSTVAEILQDKGRIKWQAAVGIGIQILQALQVAHSKGMLHRDIKPGNILVADDGTVKVADFGLVKIMGIGDEVSIDDARSRMSISAVSDAHGAGIGLTALGSPIGTFDYMSPEQYRGEGELDTRTDLYSFGMTLYKMLTGKVARIRSKAPSKLFPDIPEVLDDICFTCMEEEPEDRYQSVNEVLEALDWLDDVTAPPAQKEVENKKRQEEEDRSRIEMQKLQDETARQKAEERKQIEAERKKKVNEERRKEEAARKTKEQWYREVQTKQRCDKWALYKGGNVSKWMAMLLLLLVAIGGWYYANHQEKAKHKVEKKVQKRTEQVDRNATEHSTETESLRFETEEKEVAKGEEEEKKQFEVTHKTSPNSKPAVTRKLYINIIVEKKTSLEVIWNRLPYPISNNSTPIISGTAIVDVGEIVSIQFKLDIAEGEWFDCIPLDGSFGDKKESFRIELVESLCDGEYIIYCQSTDRNGNVDRLPFASAKFAIDTKQPEDKGIVLNSGAKYTNSREVILTIAAVGASFAIVTENKDFSDTEWLSCPLSEYCYVLSPGDGTKKVYAKFRDSAGNESMSSCSATIYLDTVPPTAFIIDPSEKTMFTNQAQPVFCLKKTEDMGSGLAYYQVILADKIYLDNILPEDPGIEILNNDVDKHVSYLEGEIEVRAKSKNKRLIEGSYKWKIRAYDKAGNFQESQELSMNVDLRKPATFYMLAPEGNASLNTTNPTFRWIKSSENELYDSGLVTYQLVIDGAVYFDNIKSEEPIVLSNDKEKCVVYGEDFIEVTAQPGGRHLSEGIHTWKVLAIDAAGNVRENALGEHTFKVDVSFFSRLKKYLK